MTSQKKILLPAVIETMEEPLLDTPSHHHEEDSVECNAQARVHGAVIGALSQIINISGTALIAFRWGVNACIFSEHDCVWDLLLHYFVFIVSQVDLLLYLIMWLGLTAALTERGIEWWKQKLGGHYSARSIFVMGVQFYAGVVIGSFLAWFSMDYALGLPAPVCPMISVLVFGLCISFSMVWCFDLEQSQAEEEEEYDLAHA